MFRGSQLFSGKRAAVAAMAVFAPLALGLVLFGYVQRFRPLAMASLWGLLVLLSWIGWGALFNRVAYGKERAGWALQAAWGMGIALFYGGLLCAASLASRGTLKAFMIVGVMLYSWSVADDVAQAYERRLWTRWRSLPVAYTLGVLLLVVLLGFQYVGSIAEYRLLLGDDLTAYATYPRKIIESGSLLDPFSIRRMSTYGGQSLLQSFTLLAGAERNLNQFDGGLCVIVMCGLIFQEAHRVRQRMAWPVLVVLLFVLMLPGRRFNLAGWMSGAVLLFAAFRLMRWEPFASVRRPANAVALGLLLSGMCTIRNSYIPMAAVTVVGMYVGLALTKDRAADRRRALGRELLFSVVACVVIVLPWLVLAWRSNQTFLFPLVKGTYNPAYNLLRGSFPELTGLMRAKAVWANLMHHDPIKTLPLFLLPALFLADSSERKALRVMLVTALIGFMAVVWGFPASDPFSNERYTFAALLPAVLATTIIALELLAGEQRLRSSSQLAAAGLALLALVLQIHESRESMQKTYESHLERIWDASKDKRQPWREYTYQEMQNQVPAGAPIVAMVDEPHWFDFRRNRVMLLDHPGGASLAPGWPLLGSHDDSADYFVSRGLRYLAVVKPSASKEAYRRSHWERVARVMPWKLVIHYYRAMFEFVEEIANQRKVLYDDGKMLLIDLASPPAPADEGAIERLTNGRDAVDDDGGSESDEANEAKDDRSARRKSSRDDGVREDDSGRRRTSPRGPRRAIQGSDGDR